MVNLFSYEKESYFCMEVLVTLYQIGKVTFFSNNIFLSTTTLQLALL